jgi:hypothetical protein
MSQKKTSTNQQRPKNALVTYSGIGIQLMFVCLVIVGAGYGLDRYFELEHTFVLVSIFLAVFAVIYLVQKYPEEQFWYYGGLLLYFGLGWFIGRLYSSSLEASNSAFYRRVMGATGLRMFFCITYLAIYLIVSDLKSVEFIGFFLIAYLLFTIFEIYQIVAKLRPEK